MDSLLVEGYGSNDDKILDLSIYVTNKRTEWKFITSSFNKRDFFNK